MMLQGCAAAAHSAARLRGRNVEAVARADASGFKEADGCGHRQICYFTSPCVCDNYLFWEDATMLSGKISKTRIKWRHKAY